MASISAGILLYRRGPAGLEVFLVHPGGPLWAGKDEAGWSIPKGLVDPGEDHEAAARREFAEEVGAVPAGELVPLGSFRQPGGKSVVAYALAGDFDPATLRSNTIEIDWPPRSGRKLTIPEVDRAAWFSPEIAAEKAASRPASDPRGAARPSPIPSKNRKRLAAEPSTRLSIGSGRSRVNPCVNCVSPPSSSRRCCSAPAAGAVRLRRHRAARPRPRNRRQLRRPPTSRRRSTTRRSSRCSACGASIRPIAATRC